MKTAKLFDAVCVPSLTVINAVKIKSVFVKTGVKRQSELVRLLLNYAALSVRRDVVR